MIGFLFARVSVRLLLSVAPDFEREPKTTRQRVGADCQGAGRQCSTYTDGSASLGGDGQVPWLQSRGAICRRAFLGAGRGLFDDSGRLDGLDAASTGERDVAMDDAILYGA